MSTPNECRWCGCSKVLSATVESVYFGCLTRYCDYDGEWYISDTCAHTLVHTAHTLRMVAISKAKQKLAVEILEAKE